jgi:DNA mismatch endonuclease (patch repair protein)
VPDVFSKEKRSWVMSRIRGKDTKPEAYVELLLRRCGAPYVKYPKLPGKPDFAVDSAKLALFVDGDFWHGYRMGPKALSRMSAFWRNKILGNKARDRRVNASLKRRGWTVVRVWEHEIEENPAEVSERITELFKPTQSA